MQAKFNRRPEKRQILRRHRHRERDRQVDLATALDSPQPGGTQVRAAQKQLALGLDAIELEIKLDVGAADRSRQAANELLIASDAHAVGVEQKVIDPRVVLNPFDQFKKLRVQRRLAPGQLQDFNAAFAINDTLNTLLQIRQWHSINFATAGR